MLLLAENVFVIHAWTKYDYRVYYHVEINLSSIKLGVLLAFCSFCSQLTSLCWLISIIVALIYTCIK